MKKKYLAVAFLFLFFPGYAAVAEEILLDVENDHYKNPTTLVMVIVYKDQKQPNIIQVPIPHKLTDDKPQKIRSTFELGSHQIQHIRIWLGTEVQEKRFLANHTLTDTPWALLTSLAIKIEKGKLIVNPTLKPQPTP